MITGKKAVGGDHHDPADFDEFIRINGTSAVWRRARMCPCINQQSGQAEINCPFCRTVPGTVWDDGMPIHVFGPSRVRQDRVADEAGAWFSGLSSFSFTSNVTPGHKDRVDLSESEMVVNNVRFTRGKTVGQAARSVERLRILPVLRVEFCEAIIASEWVQYVPNTDFRVLADGTVEWITELPNGTQYTMRYITRTAYIVWSPMEREEGSVKQPYRALCQRLDFFRQPQVGV